MQDESQHNAETAGGEDAPEESKYSHPSVIMVGPICVDASFLRVSIDGKTRSLTGLEGPILNFLAIHANSVCTISQISSYIWGFNDDGFTVLIKVTIRRLRQKLEPDPRNPIYILTVPDVGYTLVSHELDEAIQKSSTEADV